MKRTDITNLFPDATDDQIKTLMDINGADVNKVKAQLQETSAELQSVTEELQKLKENNPADELEKAVTKANQLQEELDGIKRADEIRSIREKVAKDLKIPTELLTGETEDDCKAQATAILSFARPTGYPQVRDGGEVRTTGTKTTRDQFSEWFDAQM